MADEDRGEVFAPGNCVAHPCGDRVVLHRPGAALWARAQRPVRVTPFTLEQITVSYVKNPAGEVLERRITARRSDSSQAYYGTLAGVGTPVRKIELASGGTSTLVESLRIKISTFFRSREIAARKQRLENPPEDCRDTSVYPAEELIGTEQVAGQKALVIRRSWPNRRITEWRAPKFQCFAIQERIEELVGGAAKLLAETKLLWVKTGEPDPRLFEAGSGYTEMAPSEFRRAFYRAMGVTEADCPSCFDAARDRAAGALYQANRSGP